MHKSDSDNIIYELAEHYEDQNLFELHKLLSNRNLFIPSSNREVKIAEISDMKLAIFYTGMHPSWGGKNFSILKYIDALEMVLSAKELNGMVLHNKQESWVGIDKDKIMWLMAQS